MIDALRKTSRKALTIAGAALIFGALAFAYLADVGGNDHDADPVGWLIVSGVASLILAALMLRLVPRTVADPAGGNKPARIALVLSVLAFITGFLFWTGLPFAIGIPAMVLAAEGVARSAAQGRKAEATAALVIAFLAVVLSAVASVIG